MRPTIGLFHKHPHASAHCCIGMLKALGDQFRVKLLGIEDCTYRRMRSMQLVAFPGGVGEADEWSKLFKNQVGDVRRFVQGGGGYLGICMGAYWTGPGYFDLIPGLQIDQYIKSPGAEIRRSYMTTADVDWLGNREKMFFWDGPVMNEVGTVVARYKNGGVMALRKNNIGLIGCHPESQQSWYEKKYMRGRWHGGKHWALLREFSRDLIGT